jgi:hypothetical protein
VLIGRCCAKGSEYNKKNKNQSSGQLNNRRRTARHERKRKSPGVYRGLFCS